MVNSSPVRNLQSALRKISEYNPSVTSVIPDGIFGKSTERAVKDFQREYGLEETGAADYETHKAIYEIYGEILKAEKEPLPLQAADLYSFPLLKGSSGSLVLLLQAMLRVLSIKNKAFISSGITGIYDESTEEAVKNIQAIANLPQTGTVNKETWDYITILYEESEYEKY